MQVRVLHQTEFWLLQKRCKQVQVKASSNAIILQFLSYLQSIYTYSTFLKNVRILHKPS